MTATNLVKDYQVAEKLPQEFLDLLKSVTAKRPKTVIDHILAHGQITTEELQKLYGYEHPPRAARDVREQGIPLETFKVTNAQGRSIAAYRFADPSSVRQEVLSGRKVISKAFKQNLVNQFGGRCGICLTAMEARYLQVDHRIPFQVAGEGIGERKLGEYMLICGSCNRAKSWSCEHCPNWLEKHEPAICKTCYWASPEAYRHIATQELRRLDVTWQDHEIVEYDRLAKLAKKSGVPVGEFVKSLVQSATRSTRK